MKLCRGSDDSKRQSIHILKALASGLRRLRPTAADAETFLRISGGQGKSRLYMVLVMYLGKLSSRAASDLLTQTVATSDASSWPFSVVRYLQRDLTAEGLMALADNGDKRTEANAYIGIWLSKTGRREEAIPYLQWVKDNGNPKFLEYELALTELGNLK